MTDRYLFELSPDKTINSTDQIDQKKVSQFDLSEDQFEGIYAMFDSMGITEVVDPTNIRVRVWKLVGHNKKEWVRFNENADQLRSYVSYIDQEEEPTTEEEEHKEPKVRNWIEETKVAARDAALKLKKYITLLNDSDGTYQIFTSDSLELIQGMITAANWFPEQVNPNVAITKGATPDYKHRIVHAYEDSFEVAVS